MNLFGQMIENVDKKGGVVDEHFVKCGVIDIFVLEKKNVVSCT
jgi:hypothetical protein